MGKFVPNKYVETRKSNLKPLRNIEEFMRKNQNRSLIEYKDQGSKFHQITPAFGKNIEGLEIFKR